MAFYEKSLGLIPAKLLIIEIKKPNRPVIPKKNSILGKNYRKNNKTIVYNNNFDDPNFKDPKVRTKIYNINLIENMFIIKRIFRNKKISYS